MYISYVNRIVEALFTDVGTSDQYLIDHKVMMIFLFWVFIWWISHSTVSSFIRPKPKIFAGHEKHVKYAINVNYLIWKVFTKLIVSLMLALTIIHESDWMYDPSIWFTRPNSVSWAIIHYNIMHISYYFYDIILMLFGIVHGKDRQFGLIHHSIAVGISYYTYFNLL